MMTPVMTRVVRRETHSPRTVAAVLVLAVVTAAAILVGIEIVLHLLGTGSMLLAPGAGLTWLAGLPTAAPRAAVVLGAVAIALAGLVLIWLALSPGRRSKHRLGASSRAVVVDNGVIASAIADRLRREFFLPAGGVTVGVGHRDVDVTVRPEAGQEIDAADVRSSAEAEIAASQPSPALRIRARIQPRPDTGGGR